MTKVKAELNNYRQSPRKVRVVADLVRGKRVEDAINALVYTPKRAAAPIEKLIASAVANARSQSIPTENLVVKEISVDAGSTLYRRQPMSRGRAFVIRKRTSHISLVLDEKVEKVNKSNKSNKFNKSKKGQKNLVTSSEAKHIQHSN